MRPDRRFQILLAIYALLLALFLCTFNARAETRRMVKILADNQTADLDGWIVTDDDAEDPVEGIDVLLCELRCSECVFEGVATSNATGAFNFPNLLDKMYRAKAIRLDEGQTVTPEAWVVWFRR